MSSNPNSPQSQRLNIFMSIINQVRLVYRLLRDPRIPLFMKIIPFTSLIYIIFPMDFIPDVIPVLGQLDDLGVVLLAIEAFIALAPKDIVEEHRAIINGTVPNPPKGDTVIDGQWHTVNRDR